MGSNNEVPEKKSYKLNFMIDQEVKETLEKYMPSGSRSRVVNKALRRELDLIKRKKITAKLTGIRNKNVAMDTAAIVVEVKKGREKDQ
ncbi:MAG: hypothetical protein U1E11_03935 [Dethiobacteria bacterium]|nr:hypothetical protein [Dethiobacteria bacterium]